MGVFRTHTWRDTQLLHERLITLSQLSTCQAALVLLTLTLPFLQVTPLRGGPTRVGFFGDEYKQRKIGSLSIMLECGHRNYRKLDILYTNSSWFQWCFPVLIEKVCNNIGYNSFFSFRHIIERFSCVATESSCYVSVFWIQLSEFHWNLLKQKVPPPLATEPLGFSKLEFPLKCLALKILECQCKNNNRFSTNLFHVEWKVHPKNHHKGW